MTLQQPLFSAARIAQIMTEPGDPVLLPTPEQTRVIEHPLGGSTMVIAGAGSGKTETMANRVVYLVANGLADPSHILGLTFTRKAAGELNERISRRLVTFLDRLTDLGELGQLSVSEHQQLSRLHEHLGDGIDLPQVSTYNAFAAGVVQEYGALAGVAAQSVLLDDANAWRIARDIVCASTRSELAEAGDSVAQVVKRVLNLDHAIADNLTTHEQVARVYGEFERVGSLPYDEKHAGAPKQYALIATVLRNLHGSRIALDLARSYAEEKRRLGVIEFSDQLALAVETVRSLPKAAEQLRKRTPVILLDEVQDTSVGQTVLLSTLFAGSTVMAVGDPHQSIYGFRGASADNLRSFHRDFSTSQKTNQASTLSLSVSWRNPSQVLAFANTLVSPLSESAPMSVPQLVSREQYLGTSTAQAGLTEPASAPPSVTWMYPETQDEEFQAIAEWMRYHREALLRETGRLPSCAVVMRARREMPRIAEALQQLGIPTQIVGVGGLLSTPEITEIVSTLRCIWYADAGSDAIRLLSSPRFAVGPADLQGLKRAARWFGERDIAQQPLTPEDRDHATVLPDSDSEFTLIDTLDEIASLNSLEHRSLKHISAVGKQRLREAGLMLRTLRQSVSADILGLIRAVEYALLIDIELEANEASPHRGNATSHANIDAFVELVEGFLRTTDQPSLAVLLAWLERLSELDQEAEHTPEPLPGAVQIITTHGSKGLEWDLVAVPRLVTDEFPSKSTGGIGWLRPGELPDELRGDSAARPQLNWRIATTQAELRERIEGSTKKVDGETVTVTGYKQALSEQHADEERRLGYVAVTRTAKRLLLSGSFWGRTKTARPPSIFLTELQEAGLISGLPETSQFSENPAEREAHSLQWPLDPLGSRNQGVRHAAETVLNALQDAPANPGQLRLTDSGASGDGSGAPQLAGVSPQIDPVVEVLLAEHRAQQSGNREQDSRASRITASAFHEYIEDPEAAERKRKRPVPSRPYRKTRLGNLFHDWVEHRTTTAVGVTVPLFGPEALSETDMNITALAEQEADEANEDLDALIERFEASRWADRQPKHVELEVSMPFAGRQIVCKLDAVYAQQINGRTTHEVVDWKTGRAPKTSAEKELRFLQLELYRHAYAQWAGVAPEDIAVTLFYVAEGVELRGETPKTLPELEQLWWQAGNRAER